MRTITFYEGYAPQEAQMIRTTVFVDEQGFQVEFDGRDGDALHAVCCIDGQAAATMRMFLDGECAHIGRVAVLKAYRGTGLGRWMMEQAEAELYLRGVRRIELDAQLQAAGFYEKLGYLRYGSEHFDEHCPHICMKKQL